MSETPKWTERFGISSQELASLIMKSGDENPLRWCLMNGRIPEAEYLAWAMQFYQLPSVSGDFFTSPPDQPFWERIRQTHNWNSAFFPLADWQGVLMIGCLEPPRDFRSTQPHQFVLASCRHLLLLWNSLNPHQESLKTPSTVEPKPKVAIMQPPPTAATFSAPPPAVISPPVVESLQELAKNESDELQTQSAIDTQTTSKSRIQIDAPDGLVFDTLTGIPTEAVDLNGISSSGLSSASPEIETPIDMPEGIVPSAAAALNFEFSPPAKPNTLEKTEVLVKPREEPPPAPTPTPSQTAKITADDRTMLMSETESEPMERTNVTVSRAVARALDTCMSLDDLGAVSLVHIMEIFDGAMVLLMEKGKFKPWKWTDLLTSPKNKDLTAIELETPSLFRIVYRTRLPYHGNVVASPVHTAFFNAFHGGVSPVHVTVAPILIGKEVVGAVLGLAKVEISHKDNLTKIQGLAGDFGKQLSRLRATKAA